MKHIVFHLFVLICGAGVVGAAFFGAFVWWRSWNSPLAQGPYSGIPRPAPYDTAKQVFPVWKGMTLSVYSRHKTNAAPIVVMRDASGAVHWAIEASGKAGCDVLDLEFQKYSTVPWKLPRVVGIVDWTCGGREQTTWILSKDGTLKEYWYEW